MHESSLFQCKEFIVNYLLDFEELMIADVGSYDVNGTYRDLFFIGGSHWGYVGLDIQPGPNVDIVIPSGENDEWFPMYKRMFDVVISGQCLEHVPKPWKWIKQIASITKPGGLVWITAPHTWGFHEYPKDCWRVWPDGLRALFDEAGLEVIEAFTFHNDTVCIGRKPE